MDASISNAAGSKEIATDGVISVGASSGSMTPAIAIRIAWVTWLILLIVPFILFLWVVWELGISETAARRNESETWFILASIYLLIAVPAAFFWRGHIFKAYWSGKPVTPQKYVYGMFSVWLALVVGGIFSLVGCFVDRSLLPNLLPALTAFMFYVTLWPSGRAMVKSRVGAVHDAEEYEEAR